MGRSFWSARPISRRDFTITTGAVPRGYPQALATLEFLGLNSGAGIVGLNLISMAMGMVLVSSVLRREMGLSGCVRHLFAAVRPLVGLDLSGPRPHVRHAVFLAIKCVPGGSIGNETRFGMGCVAAFRGPLSQRRRVLRANDRRLRSSLQWPFRRSRSCRKKEAGGPRLSPSLPGRGLPR